MSEQRKDYFFGTTGGHERIYELDLERLVPNPDQPRRRFDEDKLRELAASNERIGLQSPILVRKLDDQDQYMIVAGERRYRAHQLLGRPTIRAIFTTGDPEEVSLIENLQRENLHPLEEAEALARLAERHGYTQEDLAKTVGKPRSTVAETLRLMDLPEPVKEECRTSDIPKFLLLQVVRERGARKQARLWEEVKSGRVTSVRQAKARRQEAAKPAQKQAAADVRQTLSYGRTFAKRIEALSDEYLAANQAEYAALMDLARAIVARMEAARSVIGEPTVVAPSVPHRVAGDN